MSTYCFHELHAPLSNVRSRGLLMAETRKGLWAVPDSSGGETNASALSSLLSSPASGLSAGPAPLHHLSAHGLPAALSCVLGLWASLSCHCTVGSAAIQSPVQSPSWAQA